jgi:rubredoxin
VIISLVQIFIGRGHRIIDMKMMRCSICGHVYNPDTGDADVEPGVDFSDLPDTWTCPICMAAKSMFITV